MARRTEAPRQRSMDHHPLRFPGRGIRCAPNLQRRILGTGPTSRAGQGSITPIGVRPLDSNGELIGRAHCGPEGPRCSARKAIIDGFTQATRRASSPALIAVRYPAPRPLASVQLGPPHTAVRSLFNPQVLNRRNARRCWRRRRCEDRCGSWRGFCCPGGCRALPSD